MIRLRLGLVSLSFGGLSEDMEQRPVSSESPTGGGRARSAEYGLHCLTRSGPTDPAQSPARVFTQLVLEQLGLAGAQATNAPGSQQQLKLGPGKRL